MIICELGFEDPDPKNPNLSFREVDFYAFIPLSAQQRYKVKNHRLSLRKNLATGKFEIYRAYMDETEEVVFTGSLREALEYANKCWNKYWGHLGKREKDKPCKHKFPQIDTFFCPKEVME
jgi:hypothetical protein